MNNFRKVATSATSLIFPRHFVKVVNPFLWHLEKAVSPLSLLQGGALVVGIEVVVLAVLGNTIQVAVRVEQLLPTFGQIRGEKGGEVASEHHVISDLGLDPLEPCKNGNFHFWFWTLVQLTHGLSVIAVFPTFFDTKSCFK